MLPDFKELLKSFNAHGVKYLVVGGYAVSFHAQPRATKDLDIFIKADAENAHAVYAALVSFGAPLGGINPDDFADPEKFIRLGSEPVAVYLLPSIDGVDFDTAWSHRVSGMIDSDPANRLAAFFISQDDLIASKLAAGRTRDLADVEELRNAATGRQRTPADSQSNEPGQS